MPRVEVLEDGSGAFTWDTAPAPLSQGRRRLIAGLAALVLAAGGVILVRNWSAERELRQEVELTATLGITSSSTVPPGGSVRYFLLVRNDGALPVSVTSVEAGDPGLRVRMQDDGRRKIGPGREIEIPLSVRLTCVHGVGIARPSLSAEIGIRREDGGSTTERADLRPTEPLLEGLGSLCLVRPDLRDHEVSGPVLRPGG